MTTLTSLPSEILTSVLTHLDYHSLVSLRLTSHSFSAVITRHHLALAFILTKIQLIRTEKEINNDDNRFITYLRSSSAFLARYSRLHQHTSNPPVFYPHLTLVACASHLSYLKSFPGFLSGDHTTHRYYNNIPDRNPADARLHPCYTCVHLLPTTSFIARQLKGKRRYGHEDCVKRMCNACHVRKGLWKKGTVITVGKQQEVLICGDCGEANLLMEEREGMLEWNRGKESKFCKQCWLKKNMKQGSEEEKGAAIMRKSAEWEQAAAMSKSLRANRCQRCWSISHKESPAEYEEGGQLMCSVCYQVAMNT